ncbi:MAG: enoyl-CoA hydratase/isomerase family protein [Magnetococcales bacterium]|nr:enoyl-CoA hydratase/isomerase family protein [Magnetococcales bacterium]
MDYQDILYHESEGVATIAINRPGSLNAFRARTCEEMIHAFDRAGWNRDIGVIVLTGVGDKAFCTGGDQSAHSGSYDGRGIIGLPLEALQGIIRAVPKPVIAKVRGFAIGGGNVLALLCDLTIASEGAVFGQVGPRVGSVDPGFGTAFMARVLGEKKAREMWFLCRRYSATEAMEMGMVNRVVAEDRLDEEVARWCAEILALSPTALALAKSSFNADTQHLAGLSQLGLHAVSLFYQTAESREGVAAFKEKRQPRFRNSGGKREGDPS